MALKVENAPPKLPLIDLSELDGPRHDQTVEAIVKAAETCGWIHVVNHDVPVELIEELKDSIHSFHNQSDATKNVYLPDVRPTRLVTFVPRSVVSTSVDILVLKYTNEEEARAHWPESCKEAVIKFVETSTKLTERILKVLLCNLGVTPEESLSDVYMGGKNLILNYYPPSVDKVVVKHTDFSTLTVLLQDHIGGLFCKLNEDGDMNNNYKGEWVEIKPIPGSLLVLVGQCLQILSNGKYKAGEHYAETPNDTDTRVSLPIFMYPRFTKKIQPLDEVVEKHEIKPETEELLFGRNNEYVYSLDAKFSSLLAV